MAKSKIPNPDSGLAPLTHNPFAKLAASQSPTPPGTPAAVAAVAAKAPPQERARERTRAITARLETRGRSGKVITRIAGLPTPALALIASRLRQALGCGGSLEGEDLILQGSLAERATAWLQSTDLSALTREATQPKPKIVEPAAPPSSPVALASGIHRRDVRPGKRVAVVQKADQESGELTFGIVRDILTSSPTHPRGIKVRLQTGEVGRVKAVYDA
ncbi:MAG TPA: YwbE family protein [Polyangiaceae bacterium]|nr:YwbE family protein [Polyangiaceae bacterium]